LLGNGRGSRRVFAAAFALGLWGLASTSLQAQKSYPLAALKAAMIQKIMAFIRWPTQAAVQPFVLAVLGDGELSARLRFIYEGLEVSGRPVKVLDVGQVAQLPACDALFIGARFADGVEALLRALSGRPVLTLGDTPGLAQRGVGVNLFVDAARRVQFEVNRGSMERSGLRPSFQLLSFAKLVNAEAP
jgi:hypothetical protein